MDVEEFIQRMESNYQCSDEFKNRIRGTLQKINEMDASTATKEILLQKAEETFLRHSKNYSNLQNIFTDINKNNGKLAENLGNGDCKTNFDIGLD